MALLVGPISAKCTAEAELAGVIELDACLVLNSTRRFGKTSLIFGGKITN